MTIFAFKETVDDRVATVLAAGKTVQTFDVFCEQLQDAVDDTAEIDEIYEPDFLDIMQNELYQGFKHPVVVVFHTDENDRDSFFSKNQIEEIQSMPARDLNKKMFEVEQEAIREATMAPEERNMTIEQEYGLNVFDPWDRRTDEEKAQGNIQKALTEAQKELMGDVSDPSFDSERHNDNLVLRSAARRIIERFAGVPELAVYGEEPNQKDLRELELETMSNDQYAEVLREILRNENIEVLNADEIEQRQLEIIRNEDPDKVEIGADGKMRIRKINTTIGADGQLQIAGIDANKIGGPVDEELRKKRQQALDDIAKEALGDRKYFEPEDFAAVLRGDGSADAVLHVEGDDRQTRKATEEVELSDVAKKAKEIYEERTGGEFTRLVSSDDEDQTPAMPTMPIPDEFK